MIAVKAILADFQEMYRWRVPYTWEGTDYSVKDGKVTGSLGCAGAFVCAYRRHGLSIYNGSNRIQRVYCGPMMSVSEAKAKGLLVPGMAVFKKRAPGDKNYKLPDCYKKGGKYYNGDLNDYYHIGLLDTDKKHVLNAQSTQTGFVRSPISQNWCGVARLTSVEYPTTGGSEPREETPMETGSYRVTAKSGSTVRVRTKPNGPELCLLRIGDVVEAQDAGNGWSLVKFTQTGYMMSKFLEPCGKGGD